MENRSETTGNSKRRGPPNKCPSERVRVSVWAHGVKAMSGDTGFNDLERQYVMATKGIRLKSRELSRAWYKYANGERGLDEHAALERQVAWADGQYPGSAQLFNAFVWDLLKIHHKEGLPGVRTIDIPKRCAVSVRAKLRSDPANFGRLGYFSYLSFFGCDKAVEIAHLDALGLLLFQVCSKELTDYAQEYVRLARKWLKIWAFELPYLAPAREPLFDMLEKQVPRLGPLTGKRGIDPAKSERQDTADAEVNERAFLRRMGIAA